MVAVQRFPQSHKLHRVNRHFLIDCSVLRSACGLLHVAGVLRHHQLSLLFTLVLAVHQSFLYCSTNWAHWSGSSSVITLSSNSVSSPSSSLVFPLHLVLPHRLLRPHLGILDLHLLDQVGLQTLAACLRVRLYFVSSICRRTPKAPL